MDGMRTRSRLAALLLTAAAAVVAAACGEGGGLGGDKAGGPGAPVVLRLANTGGNLDQTPAVEYFVKRAAELSDGNLRVEVVDRWARFASDAEQQVVRDVAANEVDLGWVGTRVFDTLGVGSFQALTAPMLIDSYPLEKAVIESGIPGHMMQGLDELAVVGLGVLPDGLRKPIGVSGPIVGPGDWRGITFGIARSNGLAEAIRALGATPAPLFGTEREKALAQGAIQGFEFGLRLYGSNPTWPHLAPYVTANVNLWPQMDVLLANPARLDALTGEQRGWLQDAARGAGVRSDAIAGVEAQAVDAACGSGARFATASAADLLALKAGFAPVYASLERQPDTKAYIERIEALKESTPSGPGLAIPSACTGVAPAQPTRTAGTAPAYLNGTYRYVLTKEDANKAGDTDTGYPYVNTITLKDGRLEGGCFGSGGGTYSVDGDRITFYSVEYGYSMTVTLTVDDQGSLHLTPVPPMDPGDAFVCFSKPWTRIG
jgi:TRAP-type C4-dicarboxylate transport system substrate-binding protein